MSKNLYFIRLLNRALESPKPRDALRQALAEIESLGRKIEYRKGHEQFLQFMSLVRAGVDKPKVIIEPEIWRKTINEWIESSTIKAPIPPIILERNDDPIATVQVGGKGSMGTVGDLRPGIYLVRLETGWILWKGQLSNTDLIWRHAFPEEPLALAAETDRAAIKTSREIELLDGELIIKVTPGRTSGRMEFFFKGRT